MPHPDRAGPSTLVQVGQQRFLFDCGRGVLMRAAAAGFGAQNISALFLTHLHSDHTTDFNDVINTRWVMSPGPNPLRVFGPVGSRQFSDRTLATLETDIGYRIAHHEDLTAPPVETRELEPGAVLEEEGACILAMPTDHSPVHPTLGFRIEAEGKVVAIAGDTVPCDGLDAICQDADIYVQTVIRSDLISQAPAPRMRDVIDYHSDVAQAGQTATRCNVGHLVLNHFVRRPCPRGEEEWAWRTPAPASTERSRCHTTR